MKVNPDDGALPELTESTAAATTESPTAATSEPAGSGEAPATAPLVGLDAGLKAYKPVEGVSGAIKCVGSDTMNNLMTLWTEGFKRIYPNVTAEVQGKGSSTAPPALIEGTVNFGMMSRSLKADEIARFEQAFGYKPTVVPTCIDMVGFYVHKDNPVASLTMPQLDAIFSKSRSLGFATDVVKWGEVGATGEFADASISLFGRNPASGTYTFVKDHILGGGDFKDAVKSQPGSAGVVQGVGKDRFAIGYSGIGYITPDVKALPVAKAEGEEPVAPTAENAYSGAYPLWRNLLIVVNAKPGEPLDPLRREFIKFIFSQEGQTAVIKDGYIPVKGDIADKTLADLKIE
ncbi:MAG TPA: phosphate ABC transporter substrate-binding protein [Pirellulales bacterium]